MQTFSQHDPRYDRLTLGNNPGVSVHGFGCFLCSLATLYQKDPTELLKVPGAFRAGGYLVSDVIAKYCGGLSLRATRIAPKGWAIAVTNKYANAGFPTHFFLVNIEKRLQVDPLDFPAKVEPLTYPIVEFRQFTGGKFTDTPPVVLTPKEERVVALLQSAYTHVVEYPTKAMQEIHEAAEVLRGNA